jgi:hypothetical protein
LRVAGHVDEGGEVGANRALAVGHHHERLPDHEGRSHDEPQVDELVRKLWRERSALVQRAEKTRTG